MKKRKLKKPIRLLVNTIKNIICMSLFALFIAYIFIEANSRAIDKYNNEREIKRAVHQLTDQSK